MHIRIQIRICANTATHHHGVHDEVFLKDPFFGLRRRGARENLQKFTWSVILAYGSDCVGISVINILTRKET